jgi:flavin-dependent dehydrogenase
VLDTILVEAAVAAGVELREGFSVQEIVKDGDVVTGIRGRGRDGATVTEHARVVVGADGIHSLVARAVAAPRYAEKPALTCYYYTYWSGAFQPHVEFSLGDGCMYVAIPTNDAQLCLAVGLAHDRFPAYRADIAGTYFRVLEAMAPELAARVRQGTQVERWMGTSDVPNFFRTPYGPGWALVGDAGYHKDPITGYGITDAFRDAELLAAALVQGLSGGRPLAAALADYERQRNDFTMPLYEFICELAALAPPTPEQQALFGALAHNPAALTQFIGVLDGTVSVPAFFAPENIGRIMAAAQRGAAA